MPLELVTSEDVTIREMDYDVNTSIFLQEGDSVIFYAWGNIWAGVWLTGLNGPRGWNWIDYDPKFPLPGTHPFCLLGKVGGAGYFYIGDDAQLSKVPAPGGQLFLRINDNIPGNGAGSFTCHIQVYRER